MKVTHRIGLAASVLLICGAPLLFPGQSSKIGLADSGSKALEYGLERNDSSRVPRREYPVVQTDSTPADFVPPACGGLWDSLKTVEILSAERIAKAVKEGALDRVALEKSLLPVRNADGCDTLGDKHPLKRAHAAFQASCRRALDLAADANGREAVFVRVVCLRDLRNYRFQVQAQAIRAVPLEQINDPSLLLEGLYGILAAENGAARRESRRIIAVAARILELDPNNPDAARFALQLQYQDWLDARMSGLDETSDDGVRAAEERLRSIRPNDPKLEEVQLSRARVQGGAAAMSAVAEELLAQNPDSTTARYYAAWAAFHRMDFPTMYREIAEVLRRDPGDRRARVTSGKLILAASAKQSPSSLPEDALFSDASGKIQLGTDQ